MVNEISDNDEYTQDGGDGDEALGKNTGFSSWMFIHMFFFHFHIVFDEKIHFQAQLLFFFILRSFLHVWCPDMIIDIFSELDRNGLFNE